MKTIKGGKNKNASCKPLTNLFDSVEYQLQARDLLNTNCIKFHTQTQGKNFTAFRYHLEIRQSFVFLGCCNANCGLKSSRLTKILQTGYNLNHLTRSITIEISSLKRIYIIKRSEPCWINQTRSIQSTTKFKSNNFTSI